MQRHRHRGAVRAGGEQSLDVPIQQRFSITGAVMRVATRTTNPFQAQIANIHAVGFGDPGQRPWLERRLFASRRSTKLIPHRFQQQTRGEMSVVAVYEPLKLCVFCGVELGPCDDLAERTGWLGETLQ